MFRALRLLAFLSFFCLSGFANALVPPVDGWNASTCSQSAHPTHGYEGQAAWSVNWVCRPPAGGSRECGYEAFNPAYSWANPYWKPMCSQSQLPPTCPSNSSAVAGGCACSAGFVEQGGQCVNPDQACQAKSGTSDVVNVTSGWQRTPSIGAGDDWLFPLKLSPTGTGKVCNGGCIQQFDIAEPCPTCGAYVSQVPSTQGLYRVSTDFMGHYSGSSCSGSDSSVTPNDNVDPPCPGFVGEVNGVKGCYGTAEKPIRPVPPDPNIDRQPKDKGNPPAGQKPSSGEASGSGGAGRTPSGGAGGSAGGPAGAAGSGKKPDGTTDKPTDEKKEQQNCGAPGQPKCGIDETGTPKGTSTFDSANDRLKADADKRDGGLDSIKSTSDKDTSWGTVPAWIDHAACSPWDLGVLELPGRSIPLLVDICVIEPYVVGVMSFLWVVGTFFAVIGMVFRVTTATAG